MSDQQVDRIEKTIDRTTANALAVNRAGGGTFSVAPQNMGELLEFAKLMSVSSFCVRPKFRGNPGACLGVALQAFRCGGDPFAWANKAYITTNKAGEEQIGYEAQLVHAVVNSSAVLQRRLRPSYEGEGTARRCKVVGFVKGETEPLEYLSPPISQIGVKNSPLWTSDPDQQLFYYSTRAWARRHVPEILLGIYVPEEIDTIDITPLAEPQREAPRQVADIIDDRPEFAVVDNDGVEYVYRAGDKAAEGIAGVLREAAMGGPDRLDGAWENNQATVEQLAREGFADEAVGLAAQYEAARSELTAPRPAVQTDAGADPGAGTAPQTPAAPHAGPAATPAPGKPQEAPQTSETAPPAKVAPDTKQAHSAPAAAAPAAPEERPFPGDLPSGPSGKLGLGVPDKTDDGRPPSRFIHPVTKAGGREPDWRTWTVGLFQPKLRQMKTAAELAYFLGDNADNLDQARAGLDADTRTELEKRIADQRKLVEAPRA